MKTLGPSFLARWEGLCASCGDEWTRGNIVGFIDDELVCNDCYEIAEEENAWEEYE